MTYKIQYLVTISNAKLDPKNYEGLQLETPEEFVEYNLENFKDGGTTLDEFFWCGDEEQLDISVVNIELEF